MNSPKGVESGGSETVCLEEDGLEVGRMVGDILGQPSLLQVARQIVKLVSTMSLRGVSLEAEDV